MHASLLSLALSALLVTAAPTSDASSGGLHKRLVVVNTPLFNGKPTTPGTQVQPGIWVGSDTIHICHIQCLNPANAQPVQAKCVTDKCLTGACEVASCVNVRSPPFSPFLAGFVSSFRHYLCGPGTVN